jgi:hypothetical protein
MYAKLMRNSHHRRNKIRENLMLAVMAVVVFGLLILAHGRGISPKWVTALLGTLFPFGVVIYAYRGKLLLRWSFWVSLSICLAVHLFGIWFVFKFLLARFQHFSTLLWFPIAFLEVCGLFIIIKRINEKLTGQRETVRLRL